MHKRGIIRYANYTVCASVFIHFCMQRKNNENIPILYIRFILFYDADNIDNNKYAKTTIIYDY